MPLSYYSIDNVWVQSNLDLYDIKYGFILNFFRLFWPPIQPHGGAAAENFMILDHKFEPYNYIIFRGSGTAKRVFYCKNCKIQFNTIDHTYGSCEEYEKMNVIEQVLNI